jgi:hypothetical protein
MATEARASWILETKQLRKELASIPGMTAETAEKMVKNLERSYTRAEKAAKRAATQVDKEWEGKLRNVEKMADKVSGGMFGDFQDAAGALGALGPAGAAAVGGIALVTAAVAGTAAGLYAVTRAGADAIDRLDALGESDAVTPEQRAAIEQANAALDALWVVADKAIVTFAADLAPAVTEAATALVDLGLAAVDTLAQFASTHSFLEEFGIFLADTLVQMILSPISMFMQLIEVLGTLGEAVGLNDNVLKRLGQGYDDLTRSIAMSVTGLDGLDDAVTETNEKETEAEKLVGRLTKRRHENSLAAKEQAEAQKKLAEEYRKELDHLGEVGRIGQAAREDLLTPVERLTVAYEEQLVTIRKLGGESQEAISATADVTLRYYRDLAKLQEQAREDGADVFVGPTPEMFDAIQEQSKEGAIALRDAYITAIDDVTSAFSAMWELDETMHRNALDRIRAKRKAELDSVDGLTEAERAHFAASAKIHRDGIMRAWNAQQSAADAQAVLNAAQSVLNIMANVPPPAWPIAIPAAAAMAGIQVGIIESQPPPRLHKGFDGMNSSEFPAILDKQELVVNRRGANTPGVRELVGAVNNGLPVGGDSMVVVALNDRVIDTYSARAMKVGRRTRLEIRRLPKSRNRGGYR